MNETDVLRLWEAHRKIAEGHAPLENTYLTDVDVVSGWSLPLTNGQPALPHASGFGWQPDHISHLMKHDWNERPTSSTLDGEKGVLLSFAGGYTYGHWIIDISTRLMIARHVLGNEDVKFLIPGPPCAWFFPFLAAYGVTPEMCISLGEFDKVRVKTLFVPSFMRINDYLPEWPFAASFARLRAYGETLAATIPDTGRSKRLWVKRTINVPSRPDLEASKLEDLLNEFGFDVVTPASLSIAEQAFLFGKADIVVGEDSSSIHNIVWGKPRLLIVLSSAERINILHLSMCKIIGIDCHYVLGESRDDGKFVIDHDRLRSTLIKACSSLDGSQS